MKDQINTIRTLFHGLDMDNGLTEGGDVRALEIYEALSELEAMAGEPAAYGMPDTQLGRQHRMMMVRLDKGQDGCTVPLYTAAPVAHQYEAGDMADAQAKAFRAGVASVQQGEPVHQFRNPHCSDWYDGVPDHHDGHGPYEVRTLYTAAPVAQQPQAEAVPSDVVLDALELAEEALGWHAAGFCEDSMPELTVEALHAIRAAIAQQKGQP